MRSLDTEEKVMVSLTAAYAVFGLAFVCVGIWCLADTSTLLGYASTLYYNSKGSQLFGMQPGYTLIPCGLLGAFALPFALVATCKPSKSFLIFYMVYLCILLLIELPMTITMLASWPTTKATLQSTLETSMTNDYVGTPYSYTHSKPNSLIFDKLMILNKCCGINSVADYTSNYNTYSSVWYAGYRSYALGNGTSLTSTIPAACCMYSNGDTMVTNSDWLNYRNYMQSQLCPYSQSNSYTAGCYSTMTTYIYNVISVSMGCYFIPIIMHVTALIAAGVVYHSAHGATSAADWSQYASHNGRGGKNGNSVQPQRRQQQQQQSNYDNEGYEGRAPPQRSANPNQYGGGWGSNNYKR